MRALGWVSFLTVAALPAPVHAQAPAQERPFVRLRYAPPLALSDCPSEPEVRDAVAAQLGYDPFRAAAPRTLSVQISSDKQLQAQIELRDASDRLLGVRRLTAGRRDCRGLAAAIVLAINVAIDPLFRSKPAPAQDLAPASPAPASPAPASPAPASPAPASPAPPDPTRPLPALAPETIARPAAPPAPQPPSAHRGVGFRASAGLSAWFGASPTVTVGFATQLGLRWRWFSCGLEGRVDLPSRTESSDSGSVQSQLLLATLLPCLHYRFFSACALLSMGALRGEGLEVMQPRQQSTLYSAAGVRLAAELRLVKVLYLRPHVDLLGVLTRTSLRIESTDIWVTPPVSGAVGLDIAVNFF